MEKWLPILETEGAYEVSNTGKIRRLYINGKVRELTPQQTIITLKNRYLKNPDKSKHTKDIPGGLRITLSWNGKRKQQFVHNIVAEYFVPNPNNYPFVHHKDGDKSNNDWKNLEWVSRSFNATKNNLQTFKGEDNNHSHLTWVQVTQIRELYENGATINDLCKQFPNKYGVPVSYTTIWNIIRERSWKEN